MNEQYPFKNPPLPYTYNALEPYITEETLYLHHNFILQQDVDNLNDILSTYPELQSLSIEELLTNPEGIPLEIRQSVLAYAGSIYNHIVFFNGMTSPATFFRSTLLYPAIIRDFGSIDNFFDELKKKTMAILGPGFTWLVTDQSGNLQIITTTCNTSPISDNLCIIAGLDVWEHSYYLQHFYSRVKYIEDWFHVMNWEEMEQRYKNCIDSI